MSNRSARLSAHAFIPALVAAVALATPFAARAGGPVISYDNDPTAQSIDDWGDCAGFQIDATFMADRRNEDFLDTDGNLVLERRHVSFTGTLYNHDRPSNSVTYTGDFTLTLDVGAGTLKFSGLRMRVVVPGSGVIGLDAGLAVIGLGTGEVVKHGPNGDLTRICAVLGS
jgi:hypothetical protein